MKKILAKLQYAWLFVWYFFEALFNQAIANYLDWRMEYGRRRWTAYGTLGGGVVPLGKCTLRRATLRVSKFGMVVFCDIPKAAIFYSEKR